ncbi:MULTISPECIES: AAA family ATPase [Bacillaceae]|uniref:Nuclease SbcCD subunit C n=1 Tax=Evansella alkalicola TaxID=745819 RepID=A0ABS6JV20_9BACI|nr:MULTISPECIES: SMC family ATPase [Bacillaceae]MBU9722107.1 SMC family ATPase [Bacillus alkalicola]
MRPSKITITAFGPYKNAEVIDFNQLKGNKLFVVSGNTGAGKTTIFDAICFALYGSASGEDRVDAKLMRSDFAEDDVHTAVELEFELHNRTYRILRQLAHVKKGNKGPTGERYEFFEMVEGSEVPCVDRQIVSEINKKVEELIGLTKDQFSQIVMLPQGEFRKLLTSQTENKEAILRKIFKTEQYRWISDRLNEKRKNKSDEYQRSSQMRDRYIDDTSATLPQRKGSKLFEVLNQEHYNTNQIIEGLEEETTYYENELQINEKEEKAANIAYNKKLEAFHKAEVVNTEFKRMEEKEKQLQELIEKIPTYKMKEEKLDLAERASKLEIYEMKVNEWREEERVKKQLLANVEQSYTQALKSLEQAQKYYLTEENRKEEREQVARKLDRYNDFLPIVKEIEKNKSGLGQANENVTKLTEELATVQEKLKVKKSLKEKVSIQIKEVEAAVDQYTDKQEQLIDMRDKAKTLQDYLKVHGKQSDLVQDYKTKKLHYRKVKENYDKIEDAWFRGQATVLATHLHDGKPCPVCGSSEHPNKASNQGEVPTKETYDQWKKKLADANSAYLNAEAVMKTNQEVLDARASEALESGLMIDNAEDIFHQLVDQGKKLKLEVEAMKGKRDTLLQLRENVEQIDNELKQLDLQREKIETAYHTEKTSYETKKAVYEEQIRKIPEEIRVLSILEQKIVDLTSLKRKMEKTWSDAQEALQQAKEMETKRSTEVESLKGQLKESSKKKKGAEEQFILALSQSKFSSEEVYRRVKLSESKRDILRGEIEHFNNSFATVRQQVSDYRESLKGKMKEDLESLQSELDELKVIFEKAGEVLRKSKQYHMQSVDLRKRILDSEQVVAEIERQLNVMTDLYNVIRGNNNSKISFERYLQIEFLEHIIVAANERLSRLSNGQFHLIRSERQESHGKQSGLGLDVFDAYTGQTRDVKTLSGGEKFNASLCLALGMADIIQSYQGGVSIDTMFIDEGFGSLDEESLNKSIDTLIELQKSGRMIGVISHVQDLKNALPAILEVTKTKEGFSKTEFVIK